MHTTPDPTYAKPGAAPHAACSQNDAACSCAASPQQAAPAQDSACTSVAPEAADAPQTDVAPATVAAAAAAATWSAAAAAASQASAAANAASEPDLYAELAQLKAQNLQLADQYLRARAEADNARRRADDEITKARKFAVEALAESLLPVLDSLEAGLALPDASAQQLRSGTEATLAQLQAALARHKVLPIAPAAGTRFDPHQHQAISMVPAAQDANTVVAVLQKGYTIADRVLRPAMVTVAAPE